MVSTLTTFKFHSLFTAICSFTIFYFVANQFKIKVMNRVYFFLEKSVCH